LEKKGMVHSLCPWTMQEKDGGIAAICVRGLLRNPKISTPINTADVETNGISTECQNLRLFETDSLRLIYWPSPNSGPRSEIGAILLSLILGLLAANCCKVHSFLNRRTGLS
jgi:hypothetical protein